MQRYFSKEKKDEKFLLSSDDMYHITRVMRMNVGDNIEVVYQEEVYLCQIIDDFEIKVVEKIENSLKEKCSFVLVVPLLKEQKMDFVLQKATELGVSEIVPVMMERSIVKLEGKREDKKIERWQKICKEASEQSKRTDIPVVRPIGRLSDLEQEEGVKFVCSTSEKSLNLKYFLKNCQNYDKIIAVVGPEGGLSSKEEAYLETIGFTKVSLGKRIMRVETVPIFLFSVLNYEMME